jgi:hypothetical protein
VTRKSFFCGQVQVGQSNQQDIPNQKDWTLKYLYTEFAEGGGMVAGNQRNN